MDIGTGTSGGNISSSNEVFSGVTGRQIMTSSSSDVVVDSDNVKKKRRALLIVLIVFLVCGVIFALVAATFFRKDNADAPAKELYSVLSESNDDIDWLLSFFESARGGYIRIGDFAMIDESNGESESTEWHVRNAIDGLRQVNVLLQKNLTLLQDSMPDLTEELQELKVFLGENIDLYAKVSNITIGMLGFFEENGESGAIDLLRDNDANELADVLEKYSADIDKIESRLSENKCDDIENDICNAILDEWFVMEEEFMDSNIDIAEAYNLLPENDFEDEDLSIIYLISSIYIKLRDIYEE